MSQRHPRALLAWARRRPRRAAAATYLVLALILVGPGLLPGRTLSNSDYLWFFSPWSSSRPAGLVRPSNPELADAPGQLQPFVQHTKSELPHIPLWDPYIDAGRPFLANAQSQVFSPYSLPAYVMPYFNSLAWTAVMKLWVAAFGMFLLCQALGLRFGGSLLAGVVYGFNLWMVAWVSYPHMSVWTLVPWMLLATECLVRRPDLLSAGGLAAVTAIQFLCGHPESSFQAGFVTVCFCALRLAQSRAARPPLLRSVLAFCGALAGGAALAALLLIPVAELLLHSADIHQRAGTSVDVHVPTKWIVDLFFPDYWGRPTGTETQPFFFTRAFYAGALPLMLAGTALLMRRRAERIAIAILGFVAIAVVLGIPPFLQVVTRLPVFSSGHNVRLVFVYMLCLAPLAGWGLDDLCSPAIPRSRRRAVLGLGGALLLAPVAVVLVRHGVSQYFPRSALNVAWGFATPPNIFDPTAQDVIRLGALIVWLTVAGVGVLLLVARLRGRLAVGAFASLAVVLVAVDLFRAGMGYNPAIPTRYASPPATGAIRYLQAQRPARFVATVGIPQDAIPIRFHLYEARGYDLPIMSRYDRLWRREVEPQFPSQVSPFPNSIPLELLTLTERGLRTLRLLGVTDVMQPTKMFAKPVDQFFAPGTGRPSPLLRLPGLRLVYDGSDARVYRLAGALPRVVVAGAQQLVADGEAALNAITRPGFDARAVAVAEHRLPNLPVAGAGGASARPAGSATITSYQPETVTVRAIAKRRGLLVLDDNYYPGWNATVDGHAAPVERVDYTFRGVPLSPGRHTITFRYQPLSWTIGWFISLVSLMGLTLTLLIGYRRRRARPVQAPDLDRDPAQPASGVLVQIVGRLRRESGADAT